jgi:Mrp family chromosome partitioning ATPase
MSIIEEAVRKVSNSGIHAFDASSYAAALRTRRPLRPEAVDVTQARQYRPVTMDARALERNCILPRITDQAALRAFKILRTRVMRRMDANQWHSLAVTGIVPGEGKTLNAINLAMAMAQDVNTWVYLVDLDLQRPQVARSLGIEFPKGLSDYLKGEATLDEIVYNPGLPRLAVVPNAHPLPHSSEHLNSPRMFDLVAALEREVPRRVIVFDMPPLMASDDVLAFAPQVDGVLLVVSEGMTRRSALQGAQEILSEMNLVGTVLNRSRERNDNAYYGVED